MNKVITLHGKELASLDESKSESVNVTDDNSEEVKALLPENLEIELFFGDKSYTATISRPEYERMIADGVMK